MSLVLLFSFLLYVEITKLLILWPLPFATHFKRLNIKVVEKQSLLHDTKEAQIMQALSHKNIPTILGVQIQKSPMSLVIEFIGEHDTSITLRKLLSCDNYQEAVKNLQNLLTNNDWLIISHNLSEALSHIHSKGFLHCDLQCSCKQ